MNPLTRQHSVLGRLAEVVAVGTLVVLSVVVGVTVIARLVSPFELEWMGGAMLDHIEQVRAGKPLYGPPSVEFTPFIYPPGYYWVCALLAKWFPVTIAARGVSAACAVSIGWASYFIARTVGSTRRDAMLAPLWWCTANHFLEDWFDLERVDLLMMALVAHAAWGILSNRGRMLDAVSGGLLGLAFFVKQPAVLFIGASLVALVLARAYARALIVGCAALSLCATGTFLLDRLTQGWFSYYCMKLPAAHGVAAKLITVFFVQDVGRAAVFSVGTIAAIGHLFVLVRAEGIERVRQRHVTHVVFTALLVAGFAASASSRLHVGGFPNVLMFWLVLALPACSLLLTRAELVTPWMRTVIVGVSALQAGALAADPLEKIPGASRVAAEATMISRIRELESSGEVYVFGKGHVTRSVHAHINAIVDVVRSETPLPKDMIDGFQGQRFAAFVINGLGDIDLSYFQGGKDPGLFDAVARNYFVGEALRSDSVMPVSGYETAPRYILFPRKQRLDAMPRGDLETLVRLEAGLADSRLWYPRASSAKVDVSAFEAEARRVFLNPEAR